MKRLISGLLIINMILCLCGCSKSKVQTPSTDEQSPSSDEQSSTLDVQSPSSDEQSSTLDVQSPSSEEQSVPADVKPTPTVRLFISELHTASVIEKDGRVYFAASDGIYSQLPDGTDTQLVVYANEPNTLSFYGDKLYYTVSTTDGTKNLCVFENGKQITVFTDGRSGISDYQIINNRLWMTVELQLHYIDLLTGEVIDLQLSVEDFHVTDDALYYIEHANETFTIYKKDLMSGDTQIIKGNGISEPDKDIYSDFTMVGDKMYYLKRVPYGLFTDDGNGGDVLVTERDVKSIKCIDGKLMYVADDDGIASLYSFDGETEQRIATLGDYNGAFSFSCAGGKVYYSYDGACVTAPIS